MQIPMPCGHKYKIENSYPTQPYRHMHNGHLPGHVGIGDGAVAAGATHAAITVEDAWKKFFVKELAGRKLFVFG